MMRSVAGVLFAGLLLAACAKRVEDARFEGPAEAPAAAPELAGGPDAATSAAQAAADADAWRTAEPYVPPPGLIVTYRYLPDGTRVMVISNRPIPNPKPRPLPRHRWSLDGAPQPRHGPTPVQAAPAPTTAPAPTQPAAPAPTTEAKPESSAVVGAPAPLPAKPQASAPADNPLKGFVISPALWIVAGLALLVILILALMGGRKPKRRSAPRLGGEAHA